MRCLRYFALSLLLFSATRAAITYSTDPRHSFLERVWPSDYEKAESLFGEKFSADHDLVFLRIDAGIPDSALSLRKDEAGDFTLTLTAYVDGSFKKASVPFPANVAAQLERAVEYKINRNVTIGTVRRADTKRPNDLWVFLRNSEGHTETGLILFAATVDNPEATRFIDGLVTPLQRIIATEGAAREQLLNDLDRTATQVILSESP